MIEMLREELAELVAPRGRGLRSRSGGRMLTFNQLLRAANIEPELVRLVRHRDPNVQRAVFDAALRGDASFDEYQEHQGTDQIIAQFRAAKFLAAFVGEPITSETIFVGLWERLSDHPGPSPRIPLSIAGTHSASVVFETRRLEALAEYRGRIVIEWGDAARVWVQRADRQEKAIIEVRREPREPSFPGFLHLMLPLDKVANVPPAWSVALRNVRGIYLLVHRGSGAQYVGSAYGADGILGRWLSYADGHGGNVAMRELAAGADAYEATILEIVGSDATIEEICERENLWKKKLGSKAQGLNCN